MFAISLKCVFLCTICRNIEEILESRGESVKRVVGQDGTTELTLEDVVGTEKLKEALGQSGQEPPKSD